MQTLVIRAFFLVLLGMPLAITVNASDTSALDRAKLEDMRLAGNLSGWTLLYYWSPHMPLSRRGLQELRQWARVRNLRFLAVVESIGNPHWERDNSQILHAGFHPSFQFAFRKLPYSQLRRHAPSLALLKDGKLISPILPGYEQVSEIERNLRTLTNGNFAK